MSSAPSDPLSEILNNPVLLAAAGGGLLLVVALLGLIMKRRKAAAEAETETAPAILANSLENSSANTSLRNENLS